jgi:hypothetical protein
MGPRSGLTVRVARWMSDAQTGESQMKNRVQRGTAVSDVAELSQTDLQVISGGLNPQPLPPRVAFSTQLTNVAFQAFQGAFAWG